MNELKHLKLQVMHTQQQMILLIMFDINQEPFMEK